MVLTWQRGDHDLKSAPASSTRRSTSTSQLAERQVPVLGSDADSLASTHLSDRLQVRVPSRPTTSSPHLLRCVVQDKWKITTALRPASCALDAEILRREKTTRSSQPRRLSARPEHFAPRVGLTWSLDEAGTRCSGRLGAVLPEDAIQFLTVSCPRASCRLVHRQFSGDNIDRARRRDGCDRPLPREWPGRQPRLLNSMFPPARCRRRTGTVQFDSPTRTVPYTRQARAVQKQFGTAMAASVD